MSNSPTKTQPANMVPFRIPPIVFGTSSLGNLYQATTRQVKREIVAEWFHRSEGIVAADSAGKYGAGLALECMATSLRELGVGEGDITISNKLGWRRVALNTPEPTFEPGVWMGLEHDAVQDVSYEGILRCWEQGCELLSPYRPAMVSVHDPDEYLSAAENEDDQKRRWNDVLGAYTALSELRDRGEVAAIGVGSKDWRVSQRLVAACDLDWVMLSTSLTVYSHPSEVLEFVELLRQQKIAVINSAVFHAGFFTGGNFFNYRKVTSRSADDRKLIAWRDRFDFVCQKFGVTPAQACVAFGMSPPGVVATALNSSRPSRVKQNIDLVSVEIANEFWLAMKDAELVDEHYPYLGFAANHHLPAARSTPNDQLRRDTGDLPRR